MIFCHSAGIPLCSETTLSYSILICTVSTVTIPFLPPLSPSLFSASLPSLSPELWKAEERCGQPIYAYYLYSHIVLVMYLACMCSIVPVEMKKQTDKRRIKQKLMYTRDHNIAPSLHSLFTHLARQLSLFTILLFLLWPSLMFSFENSFTALKESFCVFISSKLTSVYV